MHVLGLLEGRCPAQRIRADNGLILFCITPNRTPSVSGTDRKQYNFSPLSKARALLKRDEAHMGGQRYNVVGALASSCRLGLDFK